MSNSPEGKLILILGPSGIGKGTVIKLLRKRRPEFVYPISVTTRTMRPNESEGNPYHFVSEEEFQRAINANEFLEYAEVHGVGKYGTKKDEIVRALAEGKTIVKEIDMQGYLKIRSNLSELSGITRDNVVSIFMMPASIDMLVERIKRRAPISDDELARRIKSMEFEIAHAYDCNIQILLSRDDGIENSFSRVQSAVYQSIKPDKRMKAS